MRTFLTALLSDNGASTLQAEDGQSGIDLILKEKPDLVTLDISMPGMDGGEVFKQLRENKETKMIEVSFNAAETNIDKIQEAIAKVGHDTEKFRADDETYDKHVTEMPITSQSIFYEITNML